VLVERFEEFWLSGAREEMRNQDQRDVIR